MKLIIEDDEGRRTVVPVARPEVTIGRDEGNTIRLTERNVSRKHARIVRVNGHVEVEDLQSANGIRLNGERITGRAQVTERDLIQIGDYDLSVEEIAVNVVPPPSIANAPTLELPAISVASSPTAELPAITASAPPAIAPLVPPFVSATSDSLPPPATARRSANTSVIHLADLQASHPHRQIVELGPDQMPQLRVLNTSFSGQVFLCKRNEVSIGRTDDNDVALDHRSLSRLHAKLILDPTGEWRVLDMQSANGILVNGEGYTQATLSYGDTLELGHVKLRFEGPGGDLSAVRFTSRTRPLVIVFLLVLLLLGGIYLALRGSRGDLQAATVAPPVANRLKPPRPGSTSALPGPGGPHIVTGTPMVLPTGHPAPVATATPPFPGAPTPVTNPVPVTVPGASRPIGQNPMAPPALPNDVEPTPHELAERLYDEGRTLHHDQHLKEAEAVFKRCLGVDPTYARCHMMLGSTYASLKDMEHGAQHYRKFIEMSPDDPHAERVRELLKKYDETAAKPAPR